MNPRVWLITGAILGAAGVALGAFGAHGLEGKLTPQRLATWEVGVRYQMYHALALFAVGLLATACPRSSVNSAGICFFSGVLIFSGCLYALCLTDVRVLGAIVPIGGVLLIVGWVLLAIAAFRVTDGK